MFKCYKNAEKSIPLTDTKPANSYQDGWIETIFSQNMKNFKLKKINDVLNNRIKYKSNKSLQKWQLCIVQLVLLAL